MRRSLALAGAALLLGTLGTVAGCSGGSSSESDANSTKQYCSALKKTRTEFQALSSGNLTGATLGQAFNRLQALADQAPKPVADDWATIDDAITQMETGLKSLGLTFSDLSSQKKLSQVDPQKLRQLGQKLQKLGDKQFQQAGQTIQQHAKKTCGVDLSK